MKRCAYLTMDCLGDFVAYDELTKAPLMRLGWKVNDIPWRRTGVDWDEYDAVVIRTPWDYQRDPELFLKLLARIDRSRPQLHNGLDIVRWNIKKTYLRDLEDRGVPVVPTLWSRDLSEQRILELHEQLGTEQFVIKPLIGATADDTLRLHRGQSSSETQQAIEIFRDRPFLAQPFVDSVVEVGEFSLFYFAGEYSHAILKSPAEGDFRVQEEHGGQIQSTIADTELLDAGAAAMTAIDTILLYARVDLVRLPDGTPAIMELELIEPSLYFAYNERSPQRFAEALDRLVAIDG